MFIFTQLTKKKKETKKKDEFLQLASSNQDPKVGTLPLGQMSASHQSCPVMRLAFLRRDQSPPLVTFLKCLHRELAEKIGKVKKCQLCAKTPWLCHFWAPFRGPRASCSGMEVLGRGLSPLCSHIEFSSRRSLAYSTRLPYSALHKPPKSPAPFWFLPPNRGFLLQGPSRCVLWDLCSSIFEPPSGTCLKPAFVPGQQFPSLPPTGRLGWLPKPHTPQGWAESCRLLPFVATRLRLLWPAGSVTMPSIPLLPPLHMTPPRKSPPLLPEPVPAPHSFRSVSSLSAPAGPLDFGLCCVLPSSVPRSLCFPPRTQPDLTVISPLSFRPSPSLPPG